MRACACFFFSPFSFGTKSAKRRVVIESAYVIAVQTLTSEILVLSAGYSEFGLCPLSNAESGYLARSIAPGPARPSLHTLLQPGVLPDLGAMVEEQYCSSMQALNRIAGVNDDPSIAALNHPDVSEVIRQFAKNLPPKESVSPPIPPVDYFISVLASQRMERGGGGDFGSGTGVGDCYNLLFQWWCCCSSSSFALADGCSASRPRRKRKQQPRVAFAGETTGKHLSRNRGSR